MVCDFDDAANRARDVGVQYEGGLRGGGGEQGGGGGGGGVQGGAILVLLAKEYELLLSWLSLVSLLEYYLFVLSRIRKIGTLSEIFQR